MLRKKNLYTNSGICLAIALYVLANSNASSAQTANSEPTQFGENAATVNFSGTWKLNLSANQKNQRKIAIENATATLGRFQQGRARQIVQKMTAPANEIKIVDEKNQIRLSRAGHEIVVGTDQKPVTVSGPHGKKVTLRAEKRAGKLLVESRTADSTKTVVFQLSNDGNSMRQQVEIVASRLSTPIRFSNNYRR